jgi:hypothetical protein
MARRTKVGLCLRLVVDHSQANDWQDCLAHFFKSAFAPYHCPFACACYFHIPAARDIGQMRLTAAEHASAHVVNDILMRKNHRRSAYDGGRGSFILIHFLFPHFHFIKIDFQTSSLSFFSPLQIVHHRHISVPYCVNYTTVSAYSSNSPACQGFRILLHS